MRVVQLTLYSRVGCCLCKGLEDKLRDISWQKIHPQLDFSVKNIDGFEVTDDERARFSMEVPVLTLHSTKGSLVELPRVSPRLRGKGLAIWLHKQIQMNIERVN